MSRIKDVSNIKNFVDTIDGISSDVDTNLNTIKGNLTELGISSSTFNKTNLINGLRNDPTIAPINTTDNKGDVEKIDGNDYYVGMPLNASLLKLGVSGRDPEDPATIIASNDNSRTLTTDRTDGNTTTVKRWATRCAFKFRSQDYGYDRCVYEIPTQYLMEGCVGTEGRHATTFSKYPYPEEIIMISADNDKNFIHFVNAQYLDGHYNYYNGTAYNLMIVKDRTNWGVLDDAGTEFKKYISVYANNVEDSLAFYIEDSSGIGYITFPMPDRSFGDELLNTLWDCKVIWRSDAPDRDFNITVEGEYREEYVNEISWIEDTMPSNQNWVSVCYGNDKFVAVASGSNIMAYSTDGINWTEGNMPISKYWKSVYYGNGKYVAVVRNNSNIMAYSTDGINWTEGNMPSNRSWYSVCYGNGKFVAVAQSTNIMAYSTNGINWTEGNMPSNRMWNSVCYGNDKYVAVAYGINIMAYSTDGISWTQGNMPSSRNWNSVCYGNDKFVAVASNINMAYSTDGINWTEGNMPSSKSWQSVCYGDGKYVAVASINSDIMAYSTDGISWTQGNMPSNRSWYSVCYGNGKFVAVASGSNSNTMAYILTSEFELLKFKESSVSASSSETLQSVCYGNGKYVAVAYNSNIFTYSTDGISWTEGTMSSTQDWYSVCYGNGKFIAVVENIITTSNIMAYSTDGISWTECTMSGSRQWRSVCYGNGKYVAVAYPSNIFTYSTDGISWTQGNMPSSQSWSSVCYGNGKFVAVAGSTTIMAYSTDGISWTEGNMPSSQWWISVCYGNGTYVAVAYNSNIFTYSTDGISWTEGTMSSTQDWYSVCYGNGKFVAVAQSTNIMAYSTNGINWTEGNMPSNRMWNSVCYGNGTYVAVANTTKIAYALSDYLFHPLVDLDKINGRVVLTEEYNTRLTKIRDTFDNLLEMSSKLTQVNHSTLTDYNNSKLNLYQLPGYNKSTEFNIEPNGVLYKLISWGDCYICIASTELNYTIKILDKSLSSTIDSYSYSHLSDITSIYLGGITIIENTPYRMKFNIIFFYNGVDGRYICNEVSVTCTKNLETGEITISDKGFTDATISTKTINAVCQITNDKYLVFTDTGADLVTISITGSIPTTQENYGTKVKSSLLTHYGMVSIPNNAATIEANTNISFSDCGDEVLSSIQSGNLYSYDDQTQYSDDVTGYEANDEGKALTAFDTGVFTTSTGKDLLLRAKLKFTFTSDFTLA